MPKSHLDRAPSRRKSAAVEALLVALVLGAASRLPDPAPRAYVAQATVIVVAPPSVKAENPLSTRRDLPVSRDVLVLHMSSRATHARLRAAGVTADYTIAGTSSASEPLLRVTVSDRGQRQTARELREVVAQVRTTLTALQHRAGVSPGGRVTLVELGATRTPSPVPWTERIFGG